MWFPLLLFGLWALLGAIAVGLVCGTLLALPHAWRPRGERERRANVAAVVFAHLVLKALLWTRVTVQGQLDLQDGEGALIVCNHRSWLDPVVLIAYTRSNGLSKQSIRRIPVIGFFGALTGAVFFDRRDPHARTKARNDVLMLIGAGNRVQLFPEGTRTKTGALREKVYLTLVRDCYHRGHPVVATAVGGTERVLPVGQAAAVPFQTCVLDIGPTFRPADYPDVDAFADAVWGAVRDRATLLNPARPA